VSSLTRVCFSTVILIGANLSVVGPTVAAQDADMGGFADVHEEALRFVAAGTPERALALLRSVDTARPIRDPQLILLFGTLVRAAGELDSAIEMFERGLDASSPEQIATAWTELAVTRSWTGDLPGAEAAFRSALDSSPESRPARTGLARILRWRGETAEAESLYRGLLADGGDPVEAMVGMGFLAIGALQGREAIAWFDQALALAPDNAEARDGLGRIHDARRLALQWRVTRAETATGVGRAEWVVSAAYRVTPQGTASGTLNLAPRAQDVVVSDPNTVTSTVFHWTASMGWAQQLSTSWNAAASVERVSSTSGAGYLGTLESGRRLSSAWNASAGARGGHLPGVGSELMGWAGVTRVGSARRSAGITAFYGSDLRGTWSRSALVTGSTGIGDRLTVRVGVAKGWTSSVGFHEATIAGRWGLHGGHELVAELFRFDGAYRRSGLRVGAKIGL